MKHLVILHLTLPTNIFSQDKWTNEWVLGHLYAYNYMLDWVMRWHRIKNSLPGGLRSSTLPLCHRGFTQYCTFTSERGRNIFFLWNLNARGWMNPRSPTFQAGGSNHCTQDSPRIAWRIDYSERRGAITVLNAHKHSKDCPWLLKMRW